MTAEEFESLKCGDCVRNDATEEVFMVNQVRAPGFYAVFRIDAKTTERITNQLFPLRSAEGLSPHSKKPVR
jgi:2-keto-3-deoxy-galactonokinase